MSLDRATLRWGITILAFTGAVVLVGYSVFSTGTPATTVNPGEPAADELPDVQIEFRPNPGSITLLFKGGDSIKSNAVWVNLEGPVNKTWAALDPDLASDDLLKVGERLPLGTWSEGEWIRIYYQGNETQGVIARYEP